MRGIPRIPGRTHLIGGRPSSVAGCRDCRPIHRRGGAKRGKRFSAGAERPKIGISSGIDNVCQKRARKAEGADDGDVGEAQFAGNPS
jgi:hypothetical protein